VAGEAKAGFIPFADKRVAVLGKTVRSFTTRAIPQRSVMWLHHKEALYQASLTFTFLPLMK